MRALCSSQFFNTKITESSAKKGAFLYGEALLTGSVLLYNIQATNIKPNKKATTLVEINSGSLAISNSVFKDIVSSLFKLDSTTVSFNNVIISGINCVTSLSFCVIEGVNMKLSLLASQLNNIIFNKNLIAIQSTSSVLLNKVDISDAERFQGESLDEELFGLYATNINKITIKDSFLSNLALSSIKAKSSNIEVTNTAFSNRNNRRLLQQISSELDSTNIQFICLDSTNSTVSASSFTENSLNSSLNGGVNILIY